MRGSQPRNLNDAILSDDMASLRHMIMDRYDVDAAVAGSSLRGMGQKEASPVNCAIACGNMEALRILLDAGAAINHGEPLPPVMTALDAGNIDALQELQARGAKLAEAHLGQDGGTLMHMVATASSSAPKGKMVRWLAQQGVEIDTVDHYGYTPLQCILEGGISTTDDEAAVALLELGARPDGAPDNEEGDGPLLSPLGRAVSEGRIRVVNALIEKNASFCAYASGHRNTLQPSVFFHAINSGLGHDDIVQALLKVASPSNETVTYQFKTGRLMAGGDEEKGWDDTIDLLALAACKCHVGAVRLLVAHSMDVHTRSTKGRTALLACLERSRHERGEPVQETVTVLLEAGSDPNAVDAQGNGALHLLAWRYNQQPQDDAYTVQLMQALLEWGANPHLTNQSGMTALDITLTAAPEGALGPQILRTAMQQQELQGATPTIEAQRRQRRL